MIRNYIKAALRNLLHHKLFSMINIAGLAIGIAGCLILITYVNFELSYDDYHENAGRIYRVRNDVYPKGQLPDQRATTYPALGPALKANFPEVKEFARVKHYSGVVIYTDASGSSTKYREDKIYFADPAFVTLFSFRPVNGNLQSALNQPYTILLSESAARKYFGNAEPLGKKLAFKAGTEGVDFTVSGVFKDLPKNTHFKTDFLASYASLRTFTKGESESSWTWGEFYTYLLLQSDESKARLEAKWPALLNKYKSASQRYDLVREEFSLQPIQSIHLHSALSREAEVNGDVKLVYFLSIIAAFILLSAWVNYINFSTAKAMDRAKEVGVRKANGATQRQLITQFLLESVFVNLFATLMALPLVVVAFLNSQALFGQQIADGFMLFRDQSLFLLVFIVIVLIGSLLSGLYPAFVLASFKPIAVLKGKAREAGPVAGISLRKALVIFQFATSTFLVSMTLVVFRQVNYMNSQDLGIDIHRTLVVRAPTVADSTYENRLNLFKAEATRYPFVGGVSATFDIPGAKMTPFGGGQISQIGGAVADANAFYITGIDYAFLSTFNVKLLAGRNFSEDFGSDGNGQVVILNEAAAQKLGFRTAAEAVNKYIRHPFNNGRVEVIGVVKNYHQQALKYDYDPIIFSLWPGRGYYSLKLNAGNAQQAVPAIQKAWDKAFPDNPFDYFFLEDFFNKQYETDRLFIRVFGLFALLAIIIASLGLFGLLSLSAQQRTKEIGIRKVIGASGTDIFVMIARSFMKLVLIANLIVLPLTYYAMYKWLENYAFRIAISGWLLVLPALGVLLLSFLTVSYRTLAASKANPVKSLRYE